MSTDFDSMELRLEKPQLSTRGVGLALSVAFLYLLFYTAIISNVEDVPLIAAFINSALSASIKVLLLFGSWYLIIREMYKFSGWIKLAAHVFAGVIFAVGWYYSYLWIFDLLFGLEFLEGGGFLEEKTWIMSSAYFEYAITFSVIHIMDSMKKLRLRKQQAAELRELSTRQQIANLKAQLNPHFLFNTLNSINAMVSKDVGQTRDMITGLSDMLRYSIRSFEKDRVALSEELEFVRQYLELEKHRYGDRLQYAIAIDEDLSNVEIPPMIIQPIVENAVKHGIAPTEEGGEVNISISHDGEEMTVSVEDTGRGLDDPEEVNSSDGIGIRNTDEHLQKRYGRQSKLQFESLNPHGTKVWFRIPLGG
ncbi:sensor histidine kinase [Fodinibius sp. AD559]|uniref:sensor histidine kinase n=1 Tax=Fodinibius sp. AD559 TaxID=3424179 RepID=UPI004046ECAB